MMLWICNISVAVNTDMTVGVAYQVSAPSGMQYSCLSASTSMDDVKNAVLTDVQKNLGIQSGNIVYPSFQII